MKKYKSPPTAGPAETRARCKKLPLPTPFTWRNHWFMEEEDWRECVGEQVEPLFGKEGYYLHRHKNVAWVEFDGMAFLYRDRAAFEFALEVSEGNNRLDEYVYQAIGLLIRERVIHWRGHNSNLWKAYHTERTMRQLRDIERGMHLYCVADRTTHV